MRFRLSPDLEVLTEQLRTSAELNDSHMRRAARNRKTKEGTALDPAIIESMLGCRLAAWTLGFCGSGRLAQDINAKIGETALNEAIEYLDTEPAFMAMALRMREEASELIHSAGADLPHVEDIVANAKERLSYLFTDSWDREEERYLKRFEEMYETREDGMEP